MLVSYRLLSVFFVLVILFSIPISGAANSNSVVVYTSVDQVFSEPILRKFEDETGIDVKAVYDVEAAKTVGLVNRLIAEKNRPRADVFWNSEIVRTLVLKDKGLLAPYRSTMQQGIPDQFIDPEGYWTGFACRARVIIFNTDLVENNQVPGSIFELTDPKWRGRVAMAFPLLGTAATHVGALYDKLGKDGAEQFILDMNANNVLIVSGNSVVRDVVAAGEVPLGLTDTDDVLVAIARGMPVDMVFPDQDGIGTFFIPNTVSLIKNAPNPANAKRLIDYLLDPDTERMLAESESGNIPVRPGPVNLPAVSTKIPSNAMQISYPNAAKNMEVADEFIKTTFSF